jgi:tetraacyldisaccharide 4'-kinase
MLLRAPAFWEQGRGDGILPRLLWPLSAVTTAATARSVARPGWRAPVPVICCGNVTLGGSGKTTLALDLGQRLRARGVASHFLLRGYAGTFRGTKNVVTGDSAALVGDEALLLAAVGPTWIGADRAASARAAVADGADVLVLDDGLQNPTLVKDLSLLVVDGGFGFGNGRVMPAGPLREPVAAGVERCSAAVLIDQDRFDAAAELPQCLRLLRARLVPGPEVAAVVGRRVLAFAGIARPSKFFRTLQDAGVEVVERLSFPDHHRFADDEFRWIVARGRQLNALPATTPKDAARLTPAQRAAVHVVGVGLAWDDVSAIEEVLDQVTARRNTSMNRSTSVSSL